MVKIGFIAPGFKKNKYTPPLSKWIFLFEGTTGLHTLQIMVLDRVCPRPSFEHIDIAMEQWVANSNTIHNNYEKFYIENGYTQKL